MDQEVEKAVETVETVARCTHLIPGDHQTLGTSDNTHYNTCLAWSSYRHFFTCMAYSSAGMATELWEELILIRTVMHMKRMREN